MKVYVLQSQEFQGSGIVWDVYVNLEDTQKDVSLPSDIKPWTHNVNSGKWWTSSDLTWNSYTIEEFEVKEKRA